MKKRIAYIVIVVCLLIAFGATVTVEWLYDTFGHLSMDEIIFHLKVPMEGTNTDIIFTFMKQCLWKVILPTAIIAFALIYPMAKDIKIIHEIHTSERRRTIFVSLTISLLILVFSIDKIIKTTDIKEYIENQTHDSSFIANEYVRPEEANIELPEEKRNLIYIFLESMETTYYSTQDGGLSQYDLIPEISRLAKENVNFSDTDKLGGAYSIGQVLQNNGYHNYLLLGSDATFGGRRNLFRQHGNYEIWDFESARAENKADEQIWWGFTDDQLFDYAKEKVAYLAEQNEPFNFTMLIADTHFPDGYKCKDCPDKWDEQYKVENTSIEKYGVEYVNNELMKVSRFYNNNILVK